MATAVIQGVTIIGTPAEIKEFRDLCKPKRTDVDFAASKGTPIPSDKNTVVDKVDNDIKRGMKRVKDHSKGKLC